MTPRHAASDERWRDRNTYVASLAAHLKIASAPDVATTKRLSRQDKRLALALGRQALLFQEQRDRGRRID